MAWTCPDAACRATNASAATICENCGESRPAEQAGGRVLDGPTRCPFDGHPLHANGWCEAGDGYPITRSCPFVCDVCRQRLTWDGTCLSCPRYAPGDRYEYDAKGLHWRLAEKGPHRLLSADENATMARQFSALADRLIARMARRNP